MKTAGKLSSACLYNYAEGYQIIIADIVLARVCKYRLLYLDLRNIMVSVS